MWDHGHLRQEERQAVAYYYDGDYPPEARPSADEIRHPLPPPEPRDTTYEINRASVDAIRSGDEGLMRNTLSSSMNSLCAVLVANVSHTRDGERIDLDAFMTSDKYAEYRRRPQVC